MRFIDADAAKKDADERGTTFFLDSADVDEMKRFLDDQPTADVEEVRRGKWIEEQAQHVVYRLKCRAAWVKYTCPFCGKKNGRYKSNYCSNCGAKMDGGKE